MIRTHWKKLVLLTTAVVLQTPIDCIPTVTLPSLAEILQMLGGNAA